MIAVSSSCARSAVTPSSAGYRGLAAIHLHHVGDARRGADPAHVDGPDLTLFGQTQAIRLIT
jgi:hypothetical protein